MLEMREVFLVSNENGGGEQILKVVSKSGVTSILRNLEKKPLRFSQLMFKTRLNPGVLNRHLKSLMHYEIVTKEEEKYLLTYKGNKLIKILDELISIL